MASGDLKARAKRSGSSEQVDVANAFNEMAERLEAVLESQRVVRRGRLPSAAHTDDRGCGCAWRPPRARPGAAAKPRRRSRPPSRRPSACRLSSETYSPWPPARSPPSPSAGSCAPPHAAAVARWEDAASEAGHGVVATGDGELVVGSGERDLAVILDNLVENAIKYSPRGSTVEIDWERGTDGNAALRVLSQGGPLGDEELRRHLSASTAARTAPAAGAPVSACRSSPPLPRRAGGGARLSNRLRGRRRRRGHPPPLRGLCRLLTPDPYLPAHESQRTLIAFLFGVLGITAAAGIAIAANSITGEEIGLSSEPPVVAAAAVGKPQPAPAFGRRRARGRQGGRRQLGPGQ